jgi:hypothetical protein
MDCEEENQTMRIIYSYRDQEGAFDRDTTQVVVGRHKEKDDPEVDLALNQDLSISRRQARIWLADGQYWIEDLNSKYGTFVNGVDIKGKGRVPLPLDVPVRMGNTLLRLKEEQKEPSRLPLCAAVTCLATVNYSLYHCNVPFLYEINLMNDGPTPLSNVELRLLLPGYAKSEPILLPVLPAQSRHTVHPLPYLLFDTAKLQTLPVPDLSHLEVWLNDQRVPLMHPIEITMLPANAWHCVGHEAALAGFVLLHSDAVTTVVAEARRDLQRLGLKNFADASESTDPEATTKTLKALYYRLQEHYAIAYEYEPRTYAPDWQAIRFPHDVLAELAGTCIDLSVFFAACIEKVHRDPLIIIVNIGQDRGTVIQHALIGCWRRGPLDRKAIITDEGQVRAWVDAGEILVLDSQGLPKTGDFPEGMRFTQCLEKGSDYVKKYPLVYALNISGARNADVMPMPFGKGVQYERAVSLAMFRARREAEKLSSGEVGARHLFLGLLSVDQGLMQQVCDRVGKDVAERVAAATRASLLRVAQPPRVLPETKDWQAVERRAKETAQHSGALLVTEADLALALLDTPSQVENVLARVGLTREQCRDKLLTLLQQGPILSEWRSSGFSQ